MSDGGKGSAPRPIPNPEKFRQNWDEIFKTKEWKDAIEQAAKLTSDSIDKQALDELTKEQK